MRRAAQLLLLTFALPLTAEIIDRVAVSIDGSVITESDILRQIRLTALLNGEKPDYSPENKRRAADMLIEQALIRREISSTAAAPAANVGIATDVMAVLKKRYPDERSYHGALAEYKLSDEHVKRHLAWQNQLVRFVDVRFRPGVQIPERELREYYENIFLPEWRSQNTGTPPGFEDARAQVENEMLGERANSALDRWLGQTRTQTRIRYRQEVFQ